MHEAYIAGFFDGEGCVDVKTRNTLPRVRLQLAQKEPSVLIKIQSQYGGNLHPGSSGSMWTLSIQRKSEVRNFIEAILPFAYVKRGKLELALRLLEVQEADAKTGRRNSLYRETRLLLGEQLHNPLSS